MTTTFTLEDGRMTCAYCKDITVCAICGKGYAEAVRANPFDTAAAVRRAMHLASAIGAAWARDEMAENPRTFKAPAAEQALREFLERAFVDSTRGVFAVDEEQQHSEPGLYLASSYAGWLLRHACLENAADIISQQQAEIERLQVAIRKEPGA